MNTKLWIWVLCGVALLSLSAQAHQTLSDVEVVASPTGADGLSLFVPSAVLRGDELTARQSGSLGETLNGLAGVAASNFGPNASRPIIRGLDGDRIRVMNNGGATFDASSVSNDHGVAVDPLVAEQIEVVRGAAALQYGANALGGAINVIDNRIPKAPITGLIGRTELRFGSAYSELAGAALIEVGNGSFVVHADGAARSSGDMKTAGYAGQPQNWGRLLNSSSNQSGGAMGVSWFGDHMTMGLSLDSYRNHYGTGLFEQSLPIQIQMIQQRFVFAGEKEFVQSASGLQTIHWAFSQSDYSHTESVGSSPETYFKNQGWDMHVGAKLNPWTLNDFRVQGSWGLQISSNLFSALDAHSLGSSYVPVTHTDNVATYYIQELAWGQFNSIYTGLRIENNRVQSDGGDHFIAATRVFAPLSASIGYKRSLTSQWYSQLNVSFTQRPPTYYELFADGLHHATENYEKGNVNNAMERALTVDWGVKYKLGEEKFGLNLYLTEFSNYLTLKPSAVCLGTPCYEYSGVKARLYGFELEGKKVLFKTTESGLWMGTYKADYTFGEDVSNSAPLPRIAPMRLTLGLAYQQASFSAALDVLHAFSQNRYNDNKGPTAGYTFYGASISNRIFSQGYKNLYWFIRGENLTNVQGFSSTSILRDVVPLPGRNIKIGLRLNF